MGAGGDGGSSPSQAELREEVAGALACEARGVTERARAEGGGRAERRVDVLGEASHALRRPEIVSARLLGRDELMERAHRRG
ncbi:MAG: hypothetical protein M5U28_10065 [Sandaracinaceae bacterium]|nr:hypothetical protein [Sandaracinaceae bacterium]